jgi:hypothetical protein
VSAAVVRRAYALRLRVVALIASRKPADGDLQTVLAELEESGR